MLIKYCHATRAQTASSNVNWRDSGSGGKSSLSVMPLLLSTRVGI
ncbi:hypothetical protein BN137_2092 [Cronobacter condimenti 1330]|uniref:Uncharacterized protein n=1 Tax=Cronobacter condimenti 1330 TaxID=1073999 RepID=K8A0C7_9ENTR|nr:hypothetical protein BN137_2092 [Cronobacter condimenti 1330]